MLLLQWQFLESTILFYWHLSRLYYQYIPEGCEYPVLCRRLDAEKGSWLKNFLPHTQRGYGREECLLDWNEIAEGYGEFLLPLY